MTKILASAAGLRQVDGRLSWETLFAAGSGRWTSGAATKQSATNESSCASTSSVYGIEVAALRCFNVFGPRQDPNSQYSGVIPKFLSQALDGVPVVVFGDGTQSRDFT
jgi:nucleoside-diphosphate-sugar epimerase